MIQKVARGEGCGVIDLRAAVTGEDLFAPDGIHPNAAGAHKIAEAVIRGRTGLRGRDEGAYHRGSNTSNPPRSAPSGYEKSRIKIEIFYHSAPTFPSRLPRTPGS